MVICVIRFLFLENKKRKLSSYTIYQSFDCYYRRRHWWFEYMCCSFTYFLRYVIFDVVLFSFFLFACYINTRNHFISSFLTMDQVMVWKLESCSFFLLEIKYSNKKHDFCSSLFFLLLYFLYCSLPWIWFYQNDIPKKE